VNRAGQHRAPLASSDDVDGKRQAHWGMSVKISTLPELNHCPARAFGNDRKAILNWLNS
jgi:hypothetical protein